MTVETEFSKSQREERVLHLLHMLGDDVTNLVLPKLDPATTNLIRQRLPAVAQMPPSVKRQQQILEEFGRFFNVMKQNVHQTAGLKLHSADDEEEEVEEELSLELTGDPLQDLERIDVHQMVGALEQEQPRTVALMLKILSPQRIAEILQLIPEPRKEQIVREFSFDPKAPEIILRRIAATTIERAKQLPTGPRLKDDPVSRLVEVLRATEKSKRKEILNAIEEQNPDQAALISQNLYQFDDLADMDDSQIQKVLAKVDSTSLSTALFNANERIVDKIMNNLSKRARSSLLEELSFRKNVTGTQLRASRNLVASAIAEVEQENE